MTELVEETDSETKAFREGYNAAIDPYNKSNLLGGIAKTTLSSSWLYKNCNRCQHTFRLDDGVLISKSGDIYHKMEFLDCSEQQAEKDDPLDDEVVDFYLGILYTYVTNYKINAHILTKDNPAVSYLLAPAINGFKRYRCGVCSHTLRLNDIIVLCPCNPEKPQCRLAIHIDPFNGLNCWSAWFSNSKEMYCPAFSKKVKNG